MGDLRHRGKQNLTTRELQQLAREILGHDVSPEQAEAYRARLPRMARVARILREWEPRLREVEPAAVYAVSATDDEDAAG